MAVNAKKITETPSPYQSLENMTLKQLLKNINAEDQSVPRTIQRCLGSIELLVQKIIPKFNSGGRLVYIGAGTSGRLGILDASEIPPTYGLPKGRVVGLIAGGNEAIRNSVEFAEDSTELAAQDLSQIDLNENDCLIGIAASGYTPYVIGAMQYAREKGCLVGCIVSNPGTPMADLAHVAIEAIVGPEFVTGSTRMKSGTAQKLILNMISTSLMIKSGRVKGNKMVNMQLSNEKLINRGITFLLDELQITEHEASSLLKEHGSVSAALNAIGHDTDS